MASVRNIEKQNSEKQDRVKMRKGTVKINGNDKSNI